MRTVSPFQSNGSFRTRKLIPIIGVIGLVAVFIGVSVMGEAVSELADRSGMGRVTDTPIPTNPSISTEPPVPTETQIPAEQPPLKSTSVLEDEVTDSKGISMRLVTAGEFIMGGSADNALIECRSLYNSGMCEAEWFADEEPAHTVYLEDYYMDKYEVNIASYRECVTRGTCEPPTAISSSTRANYYNDPKYDNYPVIYINWNMANAYCEYRGARLPTEAEWEKGARGTDGRTYPWGNSFNGLDVNFCDSNCLNDGRNKDYNDGYADTAPVDSYPRGVSMYGIFNLAGNVWEWGADWYGETYYASSPSNNPTGPETGYARVVRGGSWNNFGDVVRVLNRNWVRATFSDNGIGFRCVR